MADSTDLSSGQGAAGDTTNEQTNDNLKGMASGTGHVMRLSNMLGKSKQGF